MAESGAGGELVRREGEGQGQGQGQGQGESLPEVEGELELTSPRRITPTFALATAWGLVLLTATTVFWLVGAVVAFASLFTGELLPMVVIAATAWLLARGWGALYQSLSARLRPPDLSETALLPDTFYALTPPLQRLILDTRTSREAIRDPSLSRTDLLRELFAWVTCITEVEGPDRDTLSDRHLDGHRLRAEVSEFYDRVDLRERALDLLERFEAQLLDRGRDPFR